MNTGAIVNLIVGVTTLASVVIGTAAFVFGIRTDVAVLQAEVKSISHDITEIRGFFEPSLRKRDAQK